MNDSVSCGRLAVEQPPQATPAPELISATIVSFLVCCERDELRLSVRLDHADWFRDDAASHFLSGLVGARFGAAGTLRFPAACAPAAAQRGMTVLPSITSGSPYTVFALAVVCTCFTAESVRCLVLTMRSLWL
jgi:hypothetical protein